MDAVRFMHAYNNVANLLLKSKRLFTRQEVRPYFEAGCIDIIQPDLTHASGLSEVKMLATTAETYDIGVAPHFPLGPIAFAACLQLGFSTPNLIICELRVKNKVNKIALLRYFRRFVPDQGSVDRYGGHEEAPSWLTVLGVRSQDLNYILNF
ncbi:enolase C-terminal domain-like protein [Mycena sanguinolenta]|nr:enolase C-terminal domain-like protein [Mycena sanguinolenta]